MLRAVPTPRNLLSTAETRPRSKPKRRLGATRRIGRALDGLPTLIVLTPEQRRAWRGIWSLPEVVEARACLLPCERRALDRGATAKLLRGGFPMKIVACGAAERRVWDGLLRRGDHGIDDSVGNFVNSGWPKHPRYEQFSTMNFVLTRKITVGDVSAARAWRWLIDALWFGPRIWWRRRASRWAVRGT